MAKVIEIDQTIHDVGLFDSRTGEACMTEKVIDITDDCPGLIDEQAILIFTRDSRRRIAQIFCPYPTDPSQGTHIHFSVDQIDREMNVRPEDDTFGSTAHDLGLTKVQLRDLILLHAPA